MKSNNSNRRSRGRGGQRRSSHSGGSNSQQKNKPNIGNVKQQLERYRSLARDAIQADDRVQAEAYYQHAEHFQRVLNEFEDRSGKSSDSKNDKSQSDSRSDSAGASDAKNVRSGDRKRKPLQEESVGNTVVVEEKAIVAQQTEIPSAAPQEASAPVESGESIEEKPVKKPRPRAKKVAAE